MAQAPSYAETIELITQLQKEKTFTNTITGPILDAILQGLIANDGAPPGANPEDGISDSEGLKKRLVGSSSTSRIQKQAAAAMEGGDGRLLELLYYTAQSTVPAFMDDDTLRSQVGGKKGTGAAIKKAIAKFWTNKSITTNLIECLEDYPPAQAAVLVDVISATWYRSSAHVYEQTTTSWASQSYWQIYHDGREIELAKRSVVVKLLAGQGYLTLPQQTDAQFIWSQGYYGYTKWPDIPIYWDPITWSASDVPGLIRLLGNTHYGAAARAELTALGY